MLQLLSFLALGNVVTLDATSESLRLTSSAAVSTDYSVSYMDDASGSFTPGSAHGNISSATTTTVLSAPGASTQRAVTAVTACNVGAGSQTLTLKHDTSGTSRTVGRATLAANECATWDNTGRLHVFDSTGMEKLSTTGGGGGGAPTTASYWVSADDATLSADVDLSALSTGLVLNTAGTPSTYAGASCTNQFPRSLNASGAATCASVNLSSDVTGSLPGGSVSGSVSSATSLASDPTDCSAGQYATAIAASGNLTCAQPSFSQLSGTFSASQVPNPLHAVTLNVDVVDAGVLFTPAVHAPQGSGVSLKSYLAAASAGTDFTLDTAENRSTGYLLRVLNQGVEKLTIQYDGSLLGSYIRATGAFQGNTYWATGSNGQSFTSGRSSGDTSADFMFIAGADPRSGAVVETRVGGYPGTVVHQMLADGAVRAGRSGGTGAFIEASGVGDSMANRMPALTCAPGGGGNCYLTLTGNEANNGFHGIVTVVNETYRDAGTGLMFQVVSREYRSPAPVADHGHYTTVALNDPGDWTFYGGSLNAYHSTHPPTVQTGAPDPLSGKPTVGAIAFGANADALLLASSGSAAADGGWDRVLTDRYLTTLVPDCDDTGGQHLNYDATTNTFSCGTGGAAGSGISYEEAAAAVMGGF